MSYSLQKEEYLKLLRNIGRDLIDNAEKYVGDYSNLRALNIHCVVSVEAVIPQITIERVYNLPQVMKGVDYREY